jgi:hypothetical protein
VYGLQGASIEILSLLVAAAVAEPLDIVASARSTLTLSISVEENPLYGYVAEASRGGNRLTLAKPPRRLATLRGSIEELD